MKFSKERKLEKYIHPDIIEFLKQKNIYNQYYFNLEEYLNKKVKENSNLQIVIPFTIGSFSWSQSKENFSFWENLHEEFNSLNSIDEYKKEFIRNLL